MDVGLDNQVESGGLAPLDLLENVLQACPSREGMRVASHVGQAPPVAPLLGHPTS